MQFPLIKLSVVNPTPFQEDYGFHNEDQIVMLEYIRFLKKLKYETKRNFYWIYYYNKRLFYPEAYIVTWDSEMNNFGDIINPFILRNITKKELIRISHPLFYNKTHYFVVGSILQRATKYTIVWGSGFISAKERCHEKPKRIYAVRGPLTRQILLHDGIDCPEIYGDPALLLPMFYYPKTIKKYKIGIIPHYVDKENRWLINIKGNQDINIIDVQDRNPLNFIDELLKCEKIASSSLHGIIVADAYDIPSVWVEFSNSVYGNGFKFIDYFMSVNRTDRKSVIIKNNTKVSEIFKNLHPYSIDIDLIKLMECCPFH